MDGAFNFNGLTVDTKSHFDFDGQPAINQDFVVKTVTAV